MEFHPERTLRAISRSGYHHIDISTDRAVLAPFLEENGLVIESVNRCSLTIVHASQKGQTTDWEGIRQEAQQKRQRSADRAKKKQLNDTTP